MDNDEIKALLAGDDSVGSTTESSEQPDRVVRGLRRTRVSVGQQQTMSFVLVKIWVSIGKVLAPFFAAFVKKHAEANAQSPRRQK